MGVLPLTFASGENAGRLGLDGSETLDLPALGTELAVRGQVTCVIRRSDGCRDTIQLAAELHTAEELGYWRHGGILPAVWREVMGAAS